MAKYNERNEEIPDKTPVELPLGYEVPESLEQMMARMIRVHSMIAQNNGAESFEEADDFNTGESDDFVSDYEMKTMEEEFIHDPQRNNPKSDPEKPKGEQKVDAQPIVEKVAQPAVA